MEMPVKALKDNFKETFGGTLRVYDGDNEASDDAPVKSISTGCTVKEGRRIEYLETITVGDFCEALAEDYGLSVKIASPDDSVIAPDDCTLASVESVQADEADYSLDTSAYQPSKASAISGEYIINVKQDDTVEVFRIFDNVKGSLRECAEQVGFNYDPSWNTRRLGHTLLRAYEKGLKQVTIGNYTIVERASGTIETYRTYNDIMGALKEVAANVGFTIDPSWDQTTAGLKLVEYLNSNK